MEHLFLVIGIWRCFIGQLECTIELNATITPQYIYSIHYPSNYDNNMYQIWEISTSISDHVINVLAMDQDIEDDYSCDKDALKIFDGLTLLGSHELVKECGWSPGVRMSSSGQTMTLLFITDDSTTARGFKLKYWSSTNSEALVPHKPTSPGTVNYTYYGLIMIVLVVILFVFVIYRICRGKLHMRNATQTTVSKTVSLNAHGQIVTRYQTIFKLQKVQRKLALHKVEPSAPNPSPNPPPKRLPNMPPKPPPSPPPKPPHNLPPNPPPNPPPPYPHSSQDPGYPSIVDNSLVAPQFQSVPPPFIYVTPSQRFA